MEKENKRMKLFIIFLVLCLVILAGVNFAMSYAATEASKDFRPKEEEDTSSSRRSRLLSAFYDEHGRALFSEEAQVERQLKQVALRDLGESETGADATGGDNEALPGGFATGDGLRIATVSAEEETLGDDIKGALAKLS